jgi:hypothetical protein
MGTRSSRDEFEQRAKGVLPEPIQAASDLTPENKGSDGDEQMSR